mmetsp:Transcript_40600/g.73382  ORF Transcript_40600/g.73382 Transcript_40600/m.73382 type:complete len:561 (-) Transcript_40600:73-1755(-)
MAAEAQGGTPEVPQTPGAAAGTAEEDPAAILPSVESVASAASDEPQQDLLTLIAVPKGLIQKLFGVSAAPLYAEFLGSFILAMTYVCVDVTRDMAFYSAGVPLMVLVLMCGLASVSGGHFNPAVSLCVGLSNKGSWRVLAKYMAVQFLGGVLGVVWATALYGLRAQGLEPRLESTGNVAYPALAAFLVEFLFTSMWCFVHLNVTLSQANNPIEEGNQFFGLALGFVLLGGNLEGQQVSGAFFNPAIAFGVTLPRFSNSVGWMMFYFVAYLLASFVAALVFRLLRGSESDARSAARTEVKHQNVPQLVVAEGAGAFIRTYLFGMGLGTKEPMGAISAGAAIAAMTYAVSDISGAHFNPVVTLAVYIDGRQGLTWQRGIVYVLTHLVFAVIAVLCYSMVHHADLYSDLTPRSVEPVHVLRMLVGEFLFSFMLGYVVLATLVNKGIDAPGSRNHFFGLAVGSTVAVAGIVLHFGGGGCINPATKLAAQLVFSALTPGPGFTWGSIAAELLGAALAAVVYPTLNEGQSCDYLDGGEEEDEGAALAKPAGSPLMLASSTEVASNA